MLGLIARNEISRAEGREGGRALATAAIALGLLNVCLTVIGVAVGITYLARPSAVNSGTDGWRFWLGAYAAGAAAGEDSEWQAPSSATINSA